MGYRIEYDSGVVKMKTNKSKKPKKKVFLGVAALLTAVLLFWPAGRYWLRDLLLPGDAEITSVALDGLVDDLSAGEPVKEALQAFCQEIIAGDT